MDQLASFALSCPQLNCYQYFCIPPSLLILIIVFFVASLILIGVFDENVIADLLLFIFCHDSLSYSEKTDICE